jgi:hypothetical protein
MVAANNNFQRMKSEDLTRWQLKDNQNDFQSFEDTFKSVKKQEDKNQTPIKQPQPQYQQTNFIQQMQSFDEQPINPTQDQKLEEAFPFDFDDQPLPNGQNKSPKGEKQEKENNAKLQQPSDPNVINVDEIQIKPNEKLTFEQLLEKELKEKNNAETIPKEDSRVIRKKPKKEFLRRTTKKAEVPVGNSNSMNFR